MRLSGRNKYNRRKGLWTYQSLIAEGRKIDLIYAMLALIVLPIMVITLILTFIYNIIINPKEIFTYKA